MLDNTNLETELERDLKKIKPGLFQMPHDPIGKGPSPAGVSQRHVETANRSGPEPIPPHHSPLPEDTINPAHYRRHPSGIECIEVTRHMNFNIGNAVKYLWRYMGKGDPIENLKKAQWYIDDEIRRLEGKR